MRKSFISPSKYVQGEDELYNLGYFIQTFGDSAILIANPDDSDRVREKLDATQEKYGVKIVVADFNGECSPEEISRIQEIARLNHCAATIGLGGGKAIDTAKCVAEGEPLIICPTIAATDAPTSHSAVVYKEDHTFHDYYYFKQSPSVVLIDTSVIAQAPVRFLVSGMGDALSTYFEARANNRARKRGVNAGLPCGVREGKCDTAYGTQTAIALARLCYENLIEYGVAAKKACEMKIVTPAFENIIETNTLLSGLGFESGGLGAAHAIYDGMTVLMESERFMHGEKVAFGTLCQLVLEDAPKEEINEVLDFCLAVGLPVCLEDIGVIDKSYERIYAVAQKACIPEESIHVLPLPGAENGFDIVKATASAILGADAIGSAYKAGHKA